MKKKSVGLKILYPPKFSQITVVQCWKPNTSELRNSWNIISVGQKNQISNSVLFSAYYLGYFIPDVQVLWTFWNIQCITYWSLFPLVSFGKFCKPLISYCDYGFLEIFFSRNRTSYSLPKQVIVKSFIGTYIIMFPYYFAYNEMVFSKQCVTNGCVRLILMILPEFHQLWRAHIWQTGLWGPLRCCLLA